MSETPEKPCRNPGCHCPSTSDSDYCSASCARGALGDIPPAECSCGHDACKTG